MIEQMCLSVQAFAPATPSPPGLSCPMTRIILHADLDAFYASVEQLDDPALRGRPVVVGGPPEARGVVAAASYEARAFGIRSAMPMSRAMRLCPDAVRVPPRFDRYGELSRAVMAIFRAHTPLIEPLSFDEAYLDVSAIASSAKDAERIGREIKRRVRDEVSLTVSIGGGTNKSIAKIASDMGKPDGLLIVPFGGEAAFLAPLPIRALWGVGPRTEQAMVRSGIRTIGDLAARSEGELSLLFGSRGPFLRDMARGVDERPIETSYERKSVGAETTFAHDLPDGPELRDELAHLAAEVERRMRHADVLAHTIAIKLRYAWFKTCTRQSSLKAPVASAATIEAVASQLLDGVVREGDRFRLLGIQCSKLVDASGSGQAPLWTADAD